MTLTAGGMRHGVLEAPVRPAPPKRAASIISRNVPNEHGRKNRRVSSRLLHIYTKKNRGIYSKYTLFRISCRCGLNNDIADEFPIHCRKQSYYYYYYDYDYYC